MLDERARNRMHNRVREVMGDDVAETMMASLPPTGWQALATKQDLADLEKRLNERIASLESRFDLELEASEGRLTAALERGLRSQVRWILAWNTGLVFAIIRFA